jgi:hypothetical protein
MIMSRFLARRFSSVALAVLSLAGGLATTNIAGAQAQYQLPSAQSTLSVGNVPMGVASADFARNGFQGVVAVNSQSNQISIYVANGSGAFAAPGSTANICGGPPVLTNAGPAFVLATDLNGDGYPDIAVTCPVTNAVDVFLNNGSGGFTTTPSLVIPVADPVAMVAGNFNHSGMVGVAVAQGSGSVTVLQNTGSGYSANSITLSGNFSGITAADFNNDGNLDLALSDSVGNKVDILTGDGTGNFTVAGSYAVGTNPSGIATADFNRDGSPDLAVSNAGSNNVSVLLGSTTGAFTVESIAPAAGTDPIGIAVTDANGDGIPDIVAFDAAVGTNTNNGSLAILLGLPSGNFQAALIEQLPDLPGSEAAVADFNRDGKPDIATLEQNNGDIILLLNNLLPTPQQGGRSFQTSPTLTQGAGNMADGVTVADFNHDGLPDIAVSYLEDNMVQVLINNGNGFNAGTSYPVGKQPYAIASADLNGDGYADLVTANTTDGTVSVLLSTGKTGNGAFGTAKTYPVGRLPFGVAIGDLNGDGIPDLAVANMGANSVSVLWGQKGGTFIAGPTLATGVNPFGVAIGDFEHNGYPSIAVTCYHAGMLYVFPNNKNGTFGNPFMTATEPYPTALVVGDFNRDGNLDIVTGNSISNNTSFFAGTGTGSFAAGVTSPALNFPVSIATADFNGDGILDLVEVAPNFGQVSVALGQGDGTFGNFQQRAAGDFPVVSQPGAPQSQPWAVAVGDFNNDGRPDIVTANTFHRVNIASPAYQLQYMKEFPPVTGGNPSINILTNSSGVYQTLQTNPKQFPVSSTTPITLTGKVASLLGGTTPTGSIIFEDTNGTVLGTALSTLNNGAASLTLQNMGSGQHVITTLYSGDSNYQPTTTVDGSLLIGVRGIPVTLSFNPTSVAYSGLISVTVTVTGSGFFPPTGTVILYAYNENGVEGSTQQTLNFTSFNGNVSTYQGQIGVDLPLGNYELYAVYTPGNYTTGSSANEPLTVTGEPMTVQLSCNPPLNDADNDADDVPGRQTCTAQVFNQNGNIVRGGVVDYSVTNGPSQVSNNSYSAEYGGYYAVFMFPNPTSTYYTVTATFPAGQGLPAGQYGGYYGSGTVTQSFCTNGPGTCTLPAAARSGQVQAFSRQSAAEFASRSGVPATGNLGRFQFQLNRPTGHPASFALQNGPRLRVIQKGSHSPTITQPSTPQNGPAMRPITKPHMVSNPSIDYRNVGNPGGVDPRFNQ